MTRNLQDALTRAENLRDFRKVNSVAFEKSPDYVDIVNLADEVDRLREELKDAESFIYSATGFDRKPEREDDHDESW